MSTTEMYLIELFLPLADNQGSPFSQEQHNAVEHVLTEKFGGFTAYPRAPARGRWKASESEQQHDDAIVYEVMVEELDVSWWQGYRKELEEAFRQERLLIRSHSVRLL
jgi:hypothetical protein